MRLCPDCKGTRLRAEARAVRLNGQNICEVAALTIRQANRFFEIYPDPAAAGDCRRHPGRDTTAVTFPRCGRPGVHHPRPACIHPVRWRVAAHSTGYFAGLAPRGCALRARRPSIGLHSRDTAKLIRILEELRDLGNTILVVEHDPDVIRAADWLVDLGPGAGELGAGSSPRVRSMK